MVRAGPDQRGEWTCGLATARELLGCVSEVGLVEGQNRGSARATDLVVKPSAIEADDRRGKAHWDADYTFAKTGRKVNNRIDAEFEFRDGLISRHRDEFDFWRWSRMALGAPGVFLGWTPIIRKAVRKQAAEGLEAFRRKAGRA